MTAEHHTDPEGLLDAYLDGALEESEKRQFEAMLQDNQPLRCQVELQRRLDASLRRCYPQPAVDTLLDRALEKAASRTGRRAVLAKATRMAAMVAIGVLAALAIRHWITPTSQNKAYQVVGVSTAYKTLVDDGFKPMWRCETDQEFADTFTKRLGQPLVLGVLPASVQAIGLSYAPAISRDTTAVLAMADGQRLVVFVDRAGAQPHESLLVPGVAGMNLYRREIGQLVLYELSPLEAPVLLPAFRIPADGENLTEKAEPDADR